MWLVVLSNYQELADITKLEDMAKLKVILFEHFFFCKLFDQELNYNVLCLKLKQCTISPAIIM